MRLLPNRAARALMLRVEHAALRFRRAMLEYVFSEYDEDRSDEVKALNVRIEQVGREIAS